MPKPLLLLHERYTAEDGDIWRSAIKQGWVTERVNRYNITDRVKGFEFIRYYGNTLHQAQLADLIPIRFDPIAPSILPSLTWAIRRSMAMMRFSELNTMAFNRPMFIKPAREKWFEARVYQPGEVIVGGAIAGDEIYISDVVEFLDEVRCFVVRGQVLTSSYYRINKVVWWDAGLDEEKINFDHRLKDTPIPDMAHRIYEEYPSLNAVVMDFARLADNSWSLIEFNEPWASGLYFCDPDKCFQCIVASQSNTYSEPSSASS